jgi:hypothetical protein
LVHSSWMMVHGVCLVAESWIFANQAMNHEL